MPDKQTSPYTPIPMHLLRSYPESVDGLLRSVELSFDNPADCKLFTGIYNPGHSFRVSIFGIVNPPSASPMPPGKATLCALPYSAWVWSPLPSTRCKSANPSACVALLGTVFLLMNGKAKPDLYWRRLRLSQHYTQRSNIFRGHTSKKTLAGFRSSTEHAHQAMSSTKKV